MKKILALVLVLMMTVPLFAFSVNAVDGDLLYEVNFKGTENIFAPKKLWAGVSSATVSEDGSAVTIVGKKGSSGNSKAMSAWGGTLVEYEIVGKSYTVVLTVKTEDDNEEVGFLFDDWTGYVVNPGQNSYNFVSTEGENHDDDVYLKTDGEGAKKNATYNGTGEREQTYAIQWKVSGSVTSPSVDSYSLYVANNGAWIEVYSLTAEDIAKVKFDWAGSGENDFEFRILHNCFLENQGSAVTVSNAAVYEGLAVSGGYVDAPAVEPEEPVGDPEFGEEVVDGTLLKTVNFASDGWTDAKADGNVGADVEIIKNGAGVKLGIHSSNNSRVMWGGLTDAASEDLPWGEGAKYTFVFNLTFAGSSDSNRKKAAFGIQVDGCNSLVVDGNGYVYWFAWNKAGKDGQGLNASGGNAERWTHITDIATTEQQTFAVEVDHDTNTMSLYVMNSDGSFGFVTSKTCEDSQLDGAWNSCETLSCRLYARNTTTGISGNSVTVSDLRIYDGISCMDSCKVTLDNGASVRMDEPTGLRFTGSLVKHYVDGLKTKTNTVTMGMLITPTDYLKGNSLEFTKEALDDCEAIEGVKYLDIDAQKIVEEGPRYIVNCAIVEIDEDNYTREFSAILYVKVTEGDDVTYIYSEYDEENNSRSVAGVAWDAYYDCIDPTEKEDNEDTYVNEVTIIIDGEEVTKYSRYTQTQLDTLYGFFGQREQ